jgi:hypothetical protein
MPYIGSTPATQNFVAGTDSFSGNGVATAFTLSRSVNSVNDIQVVVNNVVQYPADYSVSSNTLTISPAPSSGTNNIYVRYLSTTLQSVAPIPGSTQQFAGGSAANPSITFLNDTNTGIYSPAADTIAFVEGGVEAVRIDSSANVSTTGNLSVGKIVTITSNIAQPALQITGTATRGGVGYHDFLSVTNQGGGTNPNKYFRITSTGTLEIINSAYNAVSLSLSDAGVLVVAGGLATSLRGISAASVPTGSVIQVVQYDMPTSLYSSSGNSGVLDVTNWSKTFTPLYSTSKVFHIISIGLKFICDGRVFIKRGGSVVSPSLADQWREMSWDATVDMGLTTMHWLDSPSTASQITYQLAVQASGCSSTIAVGSSADFTPYWTMMEIAA